MSAARTAAADGAAGGRGGESVEAGTDYGDAGTHPPPRPLRADEAIAPDAPSARDAVGLSLEAEWRPADVPGPLRTPDQNFAGLEAARKATALRWRVDLAATGKMRVLFLSRAFTVESGSELRARADRLGHVLVWSDGRDYRVLSPGSVRTLLAERRTDAIPLVAARSTGPLTGQRRLGFPTHRWELSTRTGRLVLDQARVPQSGESGALLCRLLMELIAADPLSAPCSAEELPLRAQYTWPQVGGGIAFEVTSLSDRLAVLPSQLLVPPWEAQLAANRLPTVEGVLLEREELASLRTHPTTDSPTSAAGGQQLGGQQLGGQMPTEDGGRNDGLNASNGTDMLRFVYLDGIPVAAVGPGRTEQIPGLSRGRYAVQWRTFLGDSVEPVNIVEVPGKTAVGLSPDGGALH